MNAYTVKALWKFPTKLVICSSFGKNMENIIKVLMVEINGFHVFIVSRTIF